MSRCTAPTGRELEQRFRPSGSGVSDILRLDRIRSEVRERIEQGDGARLTVRACARDARPAVGRGDLDRNALAVVRELYVGELIARESWARALDQRSRELVRSAFATTKTAGSPSSA
jgi:hypothetical protein